MLLQAVKKNSGLLPLLVDLTSVTITILKKSVETQLFNPIPVLAQIRDTDFWFQGI